MIALAKTLCNRTGNSAYQENDGNVEHEGAKTIEEKCKEADVVNFSHADLGYLPEQRNEAVHGSADGSKVVEGNKGVHFEVSRAQKTLDHGQTQSLEQNTSHLEEEADKNKVNFAKRSDDDADDNGGNIEELLEVGLRDTKTPAGEKDSDGSGGLEHLNKGNGQVEVGQVAADQAQTEKEANGDNGAEINPTGHLDLLAAIEHSGPAGEGLGDDGGKDQMVGSEDNGVACGSVRLVIRLLQMALRSRRTYGT